MSRQKMLACEQRYPQPFSWRWIFIVGLLPLASALRPLVLELSPWQDWSFGQTTGNGHGIESTSWAPPPAGYRGMDRSYNHILGTYNGAQYHIDNAFYNPAAPKYQYFFLFLKGTARLSNFQIRFWGNSDPNASDMPNRPLTWWKTDVQLSQTTWTEVAIDLTTLPQSESFDTWWMQYTSGGTTNVTLCGFFFNTDNIPPVVTPIPPPDAPPVTLPPVGTVIDGSAFTGDIYYSNYDTGLHGAVISGDLGNLADFICSSGTPFLDYHDVANVRIQAFRESNIGPIPLTVYQYASFSVDDDGYGTWNIQDLWNNPATTSNYTVDATDFPHPGLVCAMHNADWIEVGNFSQANSTLVVWTPEVWDNQAHIIAAYASLVASNKRPDGSDTIAVEIRIRPPNIRSLGWEYAWVVNNASMNCTEGAPRWQCPDHIMFQDTQIGLLRTGLNWLYPLSDLEQAYFQRTGYSVSLDILPVIQKLTIYSEVNYAVPYTLLVDPWLIKTSPLKQSLSFPSALSLPPPANNWNGAWWDVWTIKELNIYLQEMLNNGLYNLFPLVAGPPDGETMWTTYLAFSYGGTVLNSNGRCGLLDNDNTIRALNDTIVYWRSLSPWPIDQLLNYNSSDPASVASVDPTKFGILPWRGAYTGYPSRFQDWYQQPPKDDPFQEPLFTFADSAQNMAGQPMDAPQVWSNGFTFSNKFQGPFTPIYPATGTAHVSARLVGINTKSKNKTLAFDTLMTAISRNSKLHLNCPNLDTSNYVNSGVSGYLSAKYGQGYKGTGRQLFDPMIEHSSFVGNPVAQSMSYALIQNYNPLQIAWNNILYKNMSIPQALNLSCYMIDYLTRPACTADDWEPFLVDVPGSNKANLDFKLKDSNPMTQCQLTLANSVPKPALLQAVVPTPYVTGQSGIAKAMMGLASFCMIIIFVIIVLFIVKRNAPVIRAASKLFSLLIMFGAELGLASVLMRTSRNNELNWAQCFGTYWLLAIGYGFLMGSLGVKTYRVDRIFRNRKTGFSLSDVKLMGYLGIIIGGEITFLLMYQFWLTDRSTETQVQVLVDMTVTQQQCPISHPAPTYLLYIWNALILLFAAVYAFRTRQVSSAFNENIFTVAAIALISVMSIVIVPVISLITQPDAIFLLISLGTILGSFMSILVFSIPKLLTAFNIVKLSDVLATTTTVGKTTAGAKTGTRSTVVASKSSTGKSEISTGESV